MAVDKKTFLKHVTILHDSAEQENSHILGELERLNIKTQKVSLVYGDYSFIMQGIDFSLSCVIERKSNPDELYNNLTQDRERLEREFICGNALSNQFTLLIENCTSMKNLKAYKVPDWQMKQFNRKVQNIGELCYQTIQSWQCGNRYKFNTIFVKENKDTALKIIECFYYYWRNFKLLTANRKSIKKYGSRSPQGGTNEHKN